MLKTFRESIELNKNSIKKEDVKKYSDFLINLLNKKKYSVIDYIEALYLISYLEILFLRYEDAQRNLSNLTKNLKKSLSKRILILYMHKQQEYNEYFLKKVWFLQSYSYSLQGNHPKAIESLISLLEFGKILRTGLRVKCLNLLKKSVDESKIYRHSNNINCLIDFYTKKIPNNIVVIINRSENLIGEYEVFHSILIKIIRSLISKDKFCLFSFNEKIEEKFQKNCGYYTNYNEIECDINKILNNIRNMTSHKNSNFFSNLFKIMKQSYKPDYNNFYFFFMFGYKFTNHQSKDWKNFHLTDINKDIKKLEFFLNINFLSFMMICPILEKIKKEKIVSVLKLSKRNFLYDYNSEDGYLYIQDQFKKLLKSFLLKKDE